jgi:hypothetical protein
MEPYNRPYVDPATEPGDTGTEEWADETSEEATEHPQDTGAGEAGPATDREGAVVGSPADIFDDGDAIAARNEGT